ncbi:hypothetical protein PCE1_000526 [Barthelona sp. PCE]
MQEALLNDEEPYVTILIHVRTLIGHVKEVLHDLREMEAEELASAVVSTRNVFVSSRNELSEVLGWLPPLAENKLNKEDVEEFEEILRKYLQANDFIVRLELELIRLPYLEFETELDHRVEKARVLEELHIHKMTFNECNELLMDFE